METLSCDKGHFISVSTVSAICMFCMDFIKKTGSLLHPLDIMYSNGDVLKSSRGRRHADVDEQNVSSETF